MAVSFCMYTSWPVSFFHASICRMSRSISFVLSSKIKRFNSSSHPQKLSKAVVILIMVANDFAHVTQLYPKRSLNYPKFLFQKVVLYQINAAPDLSQKSGKF